MPAESEMRIAIVSFIFSVTDLFFNVIGGLCATRGYLKYVKYLILSIAVFVQVMFIAIIYQTIYNNDACRG